MANAKEKSEQEILEDIFSPLNNVDAFEEEAQQNEQEVQQNAAQPAEQEAKPQSDNDEVRYTYWQSVADKTRNELAKATADAEYYKKLAEGKETHSPVEPEPIVEEAFPDAPAMPEMPADYNYDDAVNDQKSSSAQYVRQYQKWQQDMIQYSVEKTEYLESKLKQQDFRIKEENLRKAKEAQAVAEYQKALGKVKEDVMKIGATAEIADHFIQTMSSPDSLSIENLWKLYQAAFANTQPKAASASPGFQQAKNANTFPPPYSQLPTGAPEDTRREEDVVFDAMKAQANKITDW